jgi:hypothetical protein
MRPPATHACMRCAALSHRLSAGPLRLCPACPLLPQCPEHHHDWRAADGAGLWVCLRCGTVLASESLSPAPAPPPPPPGG